jgi:replication factor C small subunit
MAIDLWTEKYRPKTLDEYVWRDASQRQKVEEWLAGGILPHLIFSGVTGTGKTSLAKLLLRIMGIPKEDILEINASRERRIEDIQDKIIGFAGMWAFGPTGVKYVLMEEADSISFLAQKMLRAEIEQYQDNCRFMFTCNYPEKLIDAIHGRCQSFHFDALDQEEYIVRFMSILDAEGVKYEDDVLGSIVSMTYPDLRKCINLAQQNVVGGVLQKPSAEDVTSTPDYLLDVAALFKAGRILEARKLIVEQAPAEEYPSIYRFLYKNLDLWGETEEQKDDALLAIRRGLVNHAMVADPEINLAATMVELTRIIQQ